MFERNIFPDEVKRLINSGEVIKDYPTDVPYPSYLILGFTAGMPLHVFVAKEETTSVCIVVTVYEPDKKLWKPDFKSKI